MPRKKSEPPSPIELREFRSPEEVGLAIEKLQRRVQELERLDVRAAILNNSGGDDVAASNARETILNIFGVNSPEYREHQHLRIWAGPMFMNMSNGAVIHGVEQGRVHVIGVLKGLIGRLEEKRTDLAGGLRSSPSSYFDRLNLHPRIQDVAHGLFMDGHPWEAVFAGSKALINYIKERSGRHDLDGTSLVRTIFSRNDPVLAFNDLKDQTDLDEQEGMMHLYEGAVLAIRNPGGHAFPEGTDQRAIEYISLLSLLAYRVQEAKRRKNP
jgi:uncharacterized protein (TIGR02391 family)